MKYYAPVALFVFKRPEHTRKALEALAKNPEFLRSRLYIFCDGARNESDLHDIESTRALVNAWAHPMKTVIAQRENQGLAKSIVSGVSGLCAEHGRVVVVEDDLVVSPSFLGFMNSALDRYALNDDVMQVSGYMFPESHSHSSTAFLLPITSTWGWATWDRAWRHFGAHDGKIPALLRDRSLMHKFDLDGAYPYSRRLVQQLRGKTDSWGIRWYLSVFFSGGLVLYPPRSLVDNIGHDGSGTHCMNEAVAPGTATSELAECIVQLPEHPALDAKAYASVKEHLRRSYATHKRILVKARTTLSRIFR